MNFPPHALAISRRADAVTDSHEPRSLVTLVYDELLISRTALLFLLLRSVQRDLLAWLDVGSDSNQGVGLRQLKAIGPSRHDPFKTSRSWLTAMEDRCDPAAQRAKSLQRGKLLVQRSFVLLCGDIGCKRSNRKTAAIAEMVWRAAVNSRTWVAVEWKQVANHVGARVACGDAERIAGEGRADGVDAGVDERQNARTLICGDCSATKIGFGVSIDHNSSAAWIARTSVL